jgi:hypothetical protein
LKKLSRFRRVDERFGEAVASAVFEDSAATIGTRVSVEFCGRGAVVDSVLTVFRVVSEALNRLNSGNAAAKAPGSAMGWKVPGKVARMRSLSFAFAARKRVLYAPVLVGSRDWYLPAESEKRSKMTS